MGSIHNPSVADVLATRPSLTSPCKKPPNRYALGENIAVLFCPASNGKVFGVTIDRADLDRVLAVGFWRISVSSTPNKKTSRLYCVKYGDSGIVFYLHRFLLNPAPGQTVDHIHHRTLDNRRSEICVCSYSRNLLNRRTGKQNATGYRNVTERYNGRFQAKVRFNHKSHYLGTHATPALAAERVRQFLIENGAAYAAGAHA